MIRIATYNASLNRNEAGQLITSIAEKDAQVTAISKVIAQLNADILLINEFDYDAKLEAANGFLELFHSPELTDINPDFIPYEYFFTAEVNTGVLSPIDFDKNGELVLPVDGYGFGKHPGQYGMLLLSRLPLDAEHIRTFQTFPWASLSKVNWPMLNDTHYFTEAEREALRVSSKSHWDIPVKLESGERLHLLCAHPTPPVFDGEERRNYLRNAAEIQLWIDYLDQREMLDDQGNTAKLGDEPVIILGDYNNDPELGDGDHETMLALLNHARLHDTRPIAKRFSSGKPVTADFGSDKKLRVDYALPDSQLNISGAGVFWPAKGDAEGEYFIADGKPVSDHYPVWVDVEDSAN